MSAGARAFGPVSLVSISTIFYEQLFCTKVICAAFLCLKFGFVIFWRKDFGAKAAHKMLVKLTPSLYNQNNGRESAVNRGLDGRTCAI
jgi:hypothetical protein